MAKIATRPNLFGRGCMVKHHKCGNAELPRENVGEASVTFSVEVHFYHQKDVYITYTYHGYLPRLDRRYSAPSDLRDVTNSYRRHEDNTVCGDYLREAASRNSMCAMA